jgi:heat shock protein HslJ
MKYPILAAMALILAGCTDTQQIIAGAWQVDRLNGRAVQDTVEVTMDLADGAVAGSSGCNRYNADYTLDGDTLGFGTVAMTRMACQPEQMQVEADFGAALATVTRYSVTDGTMTLFAGDAPVMQARRP